MVWRLDLRVGFCDSFKNCARHLFRTEPVLAAVTAVAQFGAAAGSLSARRSTNRVLTGTLCKHITRMVLALQPRLSGATRWRAVQSPWLTRYVYGATRALPCSGWMCVGSHIAAVGRCIYPALARMQAHYARVLVALLPL